MSACIRYGALFCLSLASAWAQISTGTIVGVVEDSTGAVVPNAEVTLKNADTGETRRTRTNDRGEFNDPFVRVVQGSLSNVIGLPLETLSEVLRWLADSREATTR